MFLSLWIVYDHLWLLMVIFVFILHSKVYFRKWTILSQLKIHCRQWFYPQTSNFDGLPSFFLTNFIKCPVNTGFPMEFVNSWVLWRRRMGEGGAVRCGMVEDKFRNIKNNFRDQQFGQLSWIQRTKKERNVGLCITAYINGDHSLVSFIWDRNLKLIVAIKPCLQGYGIGFC